MGITSRLWDRMYRTTPTWELNRPDPQLMRALDTYAVDPGPGGRPRRALDLGCGTGDNAVELARRGWEVTGIDVAARPLATARQKARAAGVVVDFRAGDVRHLDVDAPFDLVVDRGLLMSLFGPRARRAYADALTRLVDGGGAVYEHQWVLPEPPRLVSRARLVAAVRGFVLDVGELEERLGDAFSIEVLAEEVIATDDPGIRRLGIPQVAATSWWLTRR